MVDSTPLHNPAARSVLETALRKRRSSPTPLTRQPNLIAVLGAQRIILPPRPSAGPDPATVFNAYDYTGSWGAGGDI